MRIFIMILLAVILVLMILGYALLVVAHEADERADRMYRKWKMQSIDSNSDAENAQYTFRKGETDVD